MECKPLHDGLGGTLSNVRWTFVGREVVGRWSWRVRGIAAGESSVFLFDLVRLVEV